MFKRLSIKQLLLLAFLLAGLLPAMLVSFFSFYQARAALKQEIKRDMQTLSIAVMNQVDSLIAERVKDASSWSKLDVMQELQIGDVDKRLSVFLTELKTSYGDAFLAIYATDLNDKVIATSEPKSLNLTVLKSPKWFSRKIQDNEVTFSTIQANEFTFTMPIYSVETQKPLGRLVTVFNWQKVQDLMNSAVKKPIATAVYENNNLLSGSVEWSGHHGYALHVQQQFPSSSITPSWQFRLQKSHSVAVAPVHRLGYVFLGLLVLTLLLAIVLVTPIAKAITQPLAKLTQFVQQVEQQPAERHLPALTGPKEVQALNLAFTSLLVDLAKTQANLTRAAKLAVVGEMAAALSHEIRTPLGILRSSADLLLREPNLSQDGREVLGFVISETERLNQLVSDLIDAARPRFPHFQTVKCDGLIAECLAKLKPQADAKKISLGFNQVDVQPVEIDINQITQVLMNLIQNAIQILPENSQLLVNITEENQQLSIHIDDDGEGVAAEHQTQLFEPFFSQRAGGVGLGLAIVKQILQAHHGDIRYSASPLGGARFTIMLPTKQG